MRRGICHRHGPQQSPCSCGLGRMSRLVEPVLLTILAERETAHGYELMAEANDRALTDSAIDAAVVYRTLRTLEDAGCVVSQWQPGSGGPHRRMYRITEVGRQHLEDWLTLLERHAEALQRFVARGRSAWAPQRGAPKADVP